MCLQMEVGLAAAKAIKAVHGKSYKVGTSPDVLCEYVYNDWEETVLFHIMVIPAQGGCHFEITWAAKYCSFYLGKLYVIGHFWPKYLKILYLFYNGIGKQNFCFCVMLHFIGVNIK